MPTEWNSFFYLGSTKVSQKMLWFSCQYYFFIIIISLSFVGVCKDTLATIADPVAHNTYGRNEGAWMKDPKGNGNVIYVTSYYYGSNLLEFRDMDTFKQGDYYGSRNTVLIPLRLILIR